MADQPEHQAAHQPEHQHSGQDSTTRTFPRRSRLLTQAEFGRVFARPGVTQDRVFRILCRRNELGHCRLGMAVSARACRTAVGRNRIKRVVRDSFRHHHHLLANGGGKDLVVLPSREAATICNSELRASLEAHWRRIANDELRPPGQRRGSHPAKNRRNQQ